MEFQRLAQSRLKALVGAKPELLNALILLVGSATLFLCFADYARRGFALTFLFSWLTGIVLLAVFFWRIRRKTVSFPAVLQKADIYPLAGIAIVFAFLYLSFPSAYPSQMNTDEVVIRDQIRIMYSREPGINPVGPSSYFGFPVFVHVFFGWLATFLGGISIDHLRSVHATFGLLCVVFSFIFFRTLGLNRMMAVLASSIIGCNHSFLSISRLVSQNATSPLLEVIALSLLFRGMITRNSFLTYCGGIAAGVAYYVHPPARVIVFIFLFAYVLSRWSFSRWKDCLIDLLPLFVGFVVAAFPMLYSMQSAPPDLLEYQHGQFLVFPQGRKIEQEQVWAKSELEGVSINVQQGLLAFNYPIHDNSNIYINYGFGFVDALTGAMIWVGLLYILIERKERAAQHREADILCATGFLFLWLIFSFIITFAPSYTRLTITLPYIGYLAAHGLLATTYALKFVVSELPTGWRQFVVRRLGSKRNGAQNICLSGLLAGIVLLNFWSLWKFAREAKTDGDRVSATFRTVEKLRTNSDWHAAISADDKSYQYYTWGMEGEWLEWMDGDDLTDRVSVIKPDALKSALSDGKLAEKINAPFTLFLNNKLWEEVRGDFAKAHPTYTVEKMLPDGSLLAVAVDNRR